MQPDHASQSISGSFSYRPSQYGGRLDIVNEHNYVMGVYDGETGIVTWQRVVLAAQREAIQRWFAEHHPVTNSVQPSVAVDTPRIKAPASARSILHVVNPGVRRRQG